MLVKSLLRSVMRNLTGFRRVLTGLVRGSQSGLII